MGWFNRDDDWNDYWGARLKNLEDAHKSEIARLEKQHKALVAVYDEFFDAVAKDLGFRAAFRASAGLLDISFWPQSPRKLAMTTPQPEIARIPTARCKGKK